MDIDTEVEELNDDTETTKAVDRLTWIVKEDATEWEKSSVTKEEYKILHQTPGGVATLLTTTMILLDDPGLLHRVATFVTNMEQELHDCNSLTPVLTCFRDNVGSNNVMAIMFDHLEPPGCLQKVIFNTSKQCQNVMKRITIKYFKFIISIVRIFLFNFDSTKDILLWVFLLSRIEILQSSSKFNGDFVIFLICANGVIIFFAQGLLGLYITTRGHRIFKLPQNLMKKMMTIMIMIILSPFVPCLVILKATSIKIEKKNLVNRWRLSPTGSPSRLARSLENFDAKIRSTTQTFAMIKLIEACLESLPQLILLLGFLTVSLIDNQSLSVTESVDTSSGVIFFVLNISFSFLTLVISIIASVDIRKETQLSLKQKCSLGLSYIFQIISRVIPMFLVVLLAIQNKISMISALVLLILPIPVHWFLQYLTCYFTSQSFKELKLFDQALHILINTFVVIPLRTPIMQEKQIHKSKQIIWSFALFMIEIFVLLSIISFLLSSRFWAPLHTILYLFGYFLYILFICLLMCIIDDSMNVSTCCGIFIVFIVGLMNIIIFVTFNNFGYQHLFVLIAGIFLPLGPLTFYHFYHSVHMWSRVNRERMESQWGSCLHGICLHGIEVDDQGGTLENRKFQRTQRTV